jgi:hypothetical protein
MAGLVPAIHVFVLLAGLSLTVPAQSLPPA